MTRVEANDAALESALRALHHRDRSESELEARLAERGFCAEDRERALLTLRRTGLLDDARFALGRAEALAGRGASDALVRHELCEAGVDADLVESAIGQLDPEIERARRIVERRGRSPRTARYLAGRGYPVEVVGAAVATDGDGELR